MRDWLRPERGAIACIAAAGLLRGLCLWATRDDAVFRVPYLDSAFYHTWARSLAEDRGDFIGPYFLGPFYPHVMSWLYRAFGADPLVVRVFQSILGVLDTALVLALARRLAGRTAAAIAALLFTLCGCFVFYEGLVVLEPLLTTLGLAAVAALVLPSRYTSIWAGCAGLLLGCATLTRPTALLLAPVVVLALVRRPRAWSHLVWCAVLWFAVLAPTLWRNHRLGGGFVVTTNGGVNFYAGNFDGATGRFRQPPGVQFFTSADVLPEAANLPTAVAPRPLTVEAVAGTRDAADSKLWFTRAGGWIRTDPGAFLALLVRRAGLTLQARDIAQIESYAFHRDRLAFFRLLFVDLTWMLPLAALGLWQARRARATSAWIVCGAAVAAFAPCILFFVTGRHRLPAVPFLAILAGGGGAALVSVARTRRWSSLLAVVILLAAGAALTRVGARPPRTAPGWESAQMAERVYTLGDLDGAIHWQEAALAVLPQRPEVALNLALYQSERARPDDLERAENLLRALVQRAPTNPHLLDALGSVLLQRGKPTAARAAWMRALQLDPAHEPALEHLRALDAAQP